MDHYKTKDKAHFHNMIVLNMMQLIVCVQCDQNPLLLKKMALKSEIRRLQGLQSR